jgi:hypothetical protein
MHGATRCKQTYGHDTQDTSRLTWVRYSQWVGHSEVSNPVDAAVWSVCGSISASVPTPAARRAASLGAIRAIIIREAGGSRLAVH